MDTVPNPTDSNFRRFVAVAIFLAVVTGASFVWEQFAGSYHSATVQEGVLYRDGARSVHEFQTAVGRVQPKMVICLVDDSEIADPAKPQFREEIDLLKKLGIPMERIPVKLGGWPTSEDVQRFLAITNQPANQPSLVHCAQGVRRTGMMVAAFQESTLGYDKDRAKAEILAFQHSKRTVDDIRHFIDAYDPKARTVNLETSQGH